MKPEYKFGAAVLAAIGVGTAHQTTVLREFLLSPLSAGADAAAATIAAVPSPLHLPILLFYVLSVMYLVTAYLDDNGVSER